jgi:hypothetical protein
MLLIELFVLPNDELHLLLQFPNIGIFECQLVMDIVDVHLGCLQFLLQVRGELLVGIQIAVDLFGLCIPILTLYPFDLLPSPSQLLLELLVLLRLFLLLLPVLLVCFVLIIAHFFLSLYF